MSKRRKQLFILLLLGSMAAVVLGIFTFRFVLSPNVTVEGRVSFKGIPPRKAVFTSKPECLQAGIPPTDESFLARDDGSLANVLVYLKESVPGSAPQADDPVRVERSHCNFKPRVFGLRVGQAIELANRDPFSHNVHCFAQENASFNVALVVGSPPVTKSFANEEIPITLQCDVHPWERAFAGVFNHPYFAITGPDGRFAFKEKLYPGTYTIVAWHERLGTLEQRVFCFGSTETVRFVFEKVFQN